MKAKTLVFCLFFTGIFLFSGVWIYFSRKQNVDVSAKHDWRVFCCDRSKTKTSNEFDVIIVGSGIGGLSCAALLAKAGYKILVLEQHSQVGGYCSSYTRDGFTFNVGVEDVSGLWKYGRVALLLQKLGLDQNDLFVRNTRLILLGNKKMILTGIAENTVTELSKLFPNEQQAIIAFFNDAEQAFIKEDSWKGMSYQQKLDEFFEDPELKKVLCTLLGYLGTKPEQAPAQNALHAALQY